MRDVEGGWDHKKAAKGVGGDRICSGSEENECVTEMNVLHRDRGPGGPEGEQEAMSDAEQVWECENVGDGAGYDGRWCWMDGATSSTHCESKQLET